MSNGHHHFSANFPLHSTTKGASLEMSAVSMQEGKITHMIPTPGSSNQQSLPGNFHYSTGTGYLNGKSNVMAQMQEQQAPCASKINCCPVQRDLGGYAGSGVHSDILNNSSPYGVSEAHMIDGMGLHRSNVQVINRTVVPETFINPSPYGISPNKPLQRHVNPSTRSTPSKISIYVYAPPLWFHYFLAVVPP